MWKLQRSEITGEIISVFRTNALNEYESVSLDHPEYLKWLEEGNTPEPADELPQE